MINLNEFLIKKHNKQVEYKYHPTTKDELEKICIKLIQDGQTDLNCIDTSKITDMKQLFCDINSKVELKDIDISQWNVSNVENMYYMFYECEQFNSDLSKWDVSNVKNMKYAFYRCKQFNSDLSNWNVSNVENMSYMFYGCKQFNCDISKWVVRKVKNMEWMFTGCEQFNSDLSKWDVSNVKNMSYMFNICKSLKIKPSWCKNKYYD